MAVLCRCRCYFTSNYYLPSLKRHVTFTGDRVKFEAEYNKELRTLGADSDDLFIELETELRRRQNVAECCSRRRDLICEQYQPLHEATFKFSNSCFSDLFVPFYGDLLNSRRVLSSYSVCSPYFEVYQIPLFSPEFCDLLLEEVSNFTQQPNLPHIRPNTMNNCGVVVDEIGLQDFIATLRLQYLNPLARIAFPDWVSEDQSLDSHRSFTVSYSPQTDPDLALHFDNAEVTVNIALSDQTQYDGGQLTFLGMAGQPLDAMQCSLPVAHKKGWALLHRGRQYHAALPVVEGRRDNLIIWMRNSALRNELCPMCWQQPSLVPVSDPRDYGDGFTLPKPLSVDVCSIL